MTLLDDLSPEERAAADAAVARIRAGQAELDGLAAPTPEEQAAAERRIRVGVGLEAPGLDIDRPTEPAPPTVDQVDQLLAEQEEREAEDFDQFWGAQKRTGKALENVCGIRLVLPARLPLRWEIESRRLMNDRSMAAVHRLFSLLFGDQALVQLIDRGLDDEQLSVLLMWGALNGQGADVTLAQARDRFLELQAKQAAGKPLVPPTVSGGTSFDTGLSSRPTSPASTRKTGKKKRSRR